jgi:hypothetical protein
LGFGRWAAFGFGATGVVEAVTEGAGRGFGLTFGFGFATT